MNASKRLGWAGCFAASVLVFGCGNGSSGDDGSKHPMTADAFVPAGAPTNACLLLSLDDIQTLVPDASGSGGDGMPTVYEQAWDVTCSWEGASASVTLSIVGAVTAAANQSLDTGGYGGDERETVSNLGDQAEYFGSSVVDETGVDAKSRSFLVAVTTNHVSPPPSKDAFIPLVRKVLTQLP